MNLQGGRFCSWNASALATHRNIDDAVSSKTRRLGKKSQVIRVRLQNRLSGEQLTNAPPAIPNIEQVGESLIEPAMRLTDAHGRGCNDEARGENPGF
jgi:hypothetical protein